MSGRGLRSPASAAASLLVPLVLVGLRCSRASGTPSFEETVTLILCNLIVVLGLQVFIGNSGVYSFGQLGFAAGGAYVAALVTLPAAFTALQTPELPSCRRCPARQPLSTLTAAVTSGLLAALVGWPLMRTSTLAIPISTFAFLIVTYGVLANWDPVTGGSSGLVSIPTTTNIESAGVWAGVAVVVALAFKRSTSGYRLQATREDEMAARSLGVGVMRERMIAFAISGALCGSGAPGGSPVGGPLPQHLLLRRHGDGGHDAGRRRRPQRPRGRRGTMAVTGVTELLRGLEDGADCSGWSRSAHAGAGRIGLGLVLLITMSRCRRG